MSVDQPITPGGDGDSGGDKSEGFQAARAEAFSPESADLGVVNGGSDSAADRLVGSIDLNMTNWAPTSFLIGKPNSEAGLLAAARPNMGRDFRNQIGNTTF